MPQINGQTQQIVASDSSFVDELRLANSCASAHRTPMRRERVSYYEVELNYGSRQLPLRHTWHSATIEQLLKLSHQVCRRSNRGRPWRSR